MRLVKRLSAPLLYFILAALVLTLNVCKPYHNWDMIGYIAAAKSFEEQDAQTLHSFTYDQLRHAVTAAEYEKLVQGEYGHAVSADASALQEQLPLYQIRPIYTGLVYLLYKTGVNIGFATHLIPGVAIAVSVVLLYLMSVAFLPKPLVHAVPFLALLFNVQDLARLSTPDGLAYLAFVVSSYLYLRKYMTILLIFFPMMLGIRPDLILFTIPLSLAIFLSERNEGWKAALSILTSVAVYIGIGAYCKNPGWATIFYFTFVHVLAHPISMPPTLTVPDYFHALAKGTKGLLRNRRSFIPFVLVVAYAFYLIFQQARSPSFANKLKSPPTILLVVCLIFLVGHFLAFPVAWDRFYSAPYLLATFSMLMLRTGDGKWAESATPVNGA